MARTAQKAKIPLTRRPGDNFRFLAGRRQLANQEVREL